MLILKIGHAREHCKFNFGFLKQEIEKSHNLM